MPRKTKEINEEKNMKKQSNLNDKINALIKNVLESDDKVIDTKKTTKKTTKKSSSTTELKAKSATKSTKTKATKSTVKEKVEEVKAKKATPKKATKTKASEKDKEEKVVTKKTAKKAAKEKEEPTATKKTATKKSTKTTTSKSTSAKSTKSKTATKAKSSSTKTASKAKTAKTVAPTVVEYYDLPYKYNQTVVKVLYQNPTTLFVYWEISDSDIENYKKTYGDNFFETTRPVLVVYNDTMNYSFEVDINDFANSWYFNINDSKCDYRVELIRRPVFYNEKIKTDYVYITSSNKIETPNDRILFSTNEPYTVYFKNTKNNNQRKVNLPKLLEQLNLTNKDFGFPIVRNVYDLYKNIYHIEDVGEFSVSLTNPSSGNPSSHSLSSRFI